MVVHAKNEGRVEDMEVSISNITESASLEKRLRSLTPEPVHLLGAIPDGYEGGTVDYNTEDKMRFAVLVPHEPFRHTDFVEAEAESTVSSLTYEYYPSFDDLQKRYMSRNPEQLTTRESVDGESHCSKGDNTSPWIICGNNPKTDSSIPSLTSGSKKKFVACVSIFFLALIAIISSTSINSRSSHSNASGLESIDHTHPKSNDDDDALKPEEYQQTHTNTSLHYPSAEGLQDDFVIVTAQSSELRDNVNISAIWNQSNNGSIDRDTDAPEDNTVQYGANFTATDVPSFVSLQAPSPTPSYHTEDIYDTPTPTYFPSYGDTLKTATPSEEPTFVFTR